MRRHTWARSHLNCESGPCFHPAQCSCPKQTNCRSNLWQTFCLRLSDNITHLWRTRLVHTNYTRLTKPTGSTTDPQICAARQGTSGHFFKYLSIHHLRSGRIWDGRELRLRLIHQNLWPSANAETLPDMSPTCSGKLIYPVDISQKMM